MFARVMVVLVLAVAGCGGDTGSNGGGGGAGGNGGGGSGGNGSASDMASSWTGDLAMSSASDMANGGGGFCGGMTCTGGKTCCVVGGTPSCATSCPDGGLSAQCSKPSDCAGATDACCITVSNYTPQSVACVPGSQCVPMLSAQGAGNDRACVTSNDCTDNLPNGTTSQLPDCCTSTASGQHVCFSKAILMVVPSLQQQFTCP